MNTCLNNIVSINAPGCDSCKKTSTSGFDLLQAPEITMTGLGQVASETYIKGINLAKEKLSLALTMVSNDFRSVLHSSRIATDIIQAEMQAADFRPSQSVASSDSYRGLKITAANNRRSPLRRLKITSIQAYPLANADSAIVRILDGKPGVADYDDYPVQLVANDVNTWHNIQHTARTNIIRVQLLAPGIPMASAYLRCSCDGSMPNGVGTIEGFDGVNAVRREGFGLNVTFENSCDYDQLLCDMSKSYIGEIIWLKTRVLLLEERLRTNRLNNWVMYGRDDIADHVVELDNEYRSKWNTLVGSLPSLLRNYKDECLECRGISWKVNI